YSYAVLIMEAAKAGEPDRVLELTADELGVSLPARCLLGVTVEEGSAVAVRGADGRSHLAFEPQWYDPNLDASRLVPREALEALEGCETVDVLARPPVRGRPELLPPQIAWRYGLGTHATRLRPKDA